MGHWDSNPNDVMSFYDELNAYGAWDKNRMAQQGKDPCCFVTGMTTTLCFTKLRALRNMKILVARLITLCKYKFSSYLCKRIWIIIFMKYTVPCPRG
jgi:hypothetical protein